MEICCLQTTALKNQQFLLNCEPLGSAIGKWGGLSIGTGEHHLRYSKALERMLGLYFPCLLFIQWKLTHFFFIKRKPLPSMFDQKFEYLNCYCKLILHFSVVFFLISIFLQNIFTIFILHVMYNGFCCVSAGAFLIGLVWCWECWKWWVFSFFFFFLNSFRGCKALDLKCY